MSAHTRPSVRFNGIRGLALAGAAALLTSACATAPGPGGSLEIGLPVFRPPIGVGPNGGIVVQPPIYTPPRFEVGQHVIPNDPARNNGWEAAGSFTVAQPNRYTGYAPVIAWDRRVDTPIQVSRVMPNTEAQLLRECGRDPRWQFNQQCTTISFPSSATGVSVTGQQVTSPLICPPNRAQYFPVTSRVPGMASTETHVTVACGFDLDSMNNRRSPYFTGIKINGNLIN